ncbi:MAG: glutamine-hydrolyzing carbamoyl-phosphate synthase small subunit [Woeseiaceae bacterium]|nr:glutamine-hydrolyzing carbamoyl-phosphate synthase small subunit [Woeseiaceae bacterium]
MSAPAILVLEDGSIFHGTSIGIEGSTTGEVVFNTSMTGYQEILSDPSYCKQIVTLTYPNIGNTGANSEDMESEIIQASGLIIRNASMQASNWRSEESFEEFLHANKLVAIADIDTRKLTKILREIGAQSGCIMGGNINPELALKEARNFSGIAGTDLAKVVSTKNAYEWSEGSCFSNRLNPFFNEKKRLNVVALDYGIKRNILRLLVDLGCKVTVLPAESSAQEILSYAPDGIFLSNGPGDPGACSYAIAAIKDLLKTSTPIFGICLGYQLLALASGAQTMKMKFGHHGANHPVVDTHSGQVAITSQNHGFAVDENTLPQELTITHRSLFDNTLQGISVNGKDAYGFQGHPEASPGPHDLMLIFNKFIKLMNNNINNK